MKIAVYYNHTGQPDKLNLLVIIPTSFDNQIISGYPDMLHEALASASIRAAREAGLFATRVMFEDDNDVPLTITYEDAEEANFPLPVIFLRP
jgi:hypothetical protein